MTFTIFAPGKLVLIGEYAVLEGAPALVGAFNRYARVQVRPAPDDNYRLSAPTIGIHDIPLIREKNTMRLPDNLSEKQREKLKFIAAAFTVFGQMTHSPLPDQPFHITIDTRDFFLSLNGTKMGLGSSAAVTVGLLTALYHLSGWDINPIENKIRIFSAAIQAHRLAQGKIGSGLDIAASVFGGIIRYEMKAMLTPSSTPPPKIESLNGLYLIAVWSGFSASTTEMVNRVFQFKKQHLTAYRKIMNRLQTTSRKAVEIFFSRDFRRFLAYVSQYYRQLEELSTGSGAPIISTVHQKISEIVTKAGGVYKPSGAGGGDLGLAFTTRKESYLQIKKTLTEHNFQIIDLQIEPEGVKLQV